MGGPSEADKQQQRTISAEELSTSREQRARSAEIYNLTFPYLKTAGEHYSKIASGDPNAIFREVAPAAEGVIGQTEAVKERIRNELPRGGESRLATELADVQKGSQVGGLISKSFLSAFPALASLSSGGLGISINEIANAISGGGQASSATGKVMEADAAGKASTMGFLGSLAGAGGQMASAAALACWIAEVCFGPLDWRVSALRQWLNFEWRNTSRVGAVVMALYCRFGQRVAMVVRRSATLQRFFRALFNRALKRMKRDGWIEEEV